MNMPVPSSLTRLPFRFFQLLFNSADLTEYAYSLYGGVNLPYRLL
jgi:hypothetical protein